MDRGVAVILMAAVGGLIAAQPAVNAGLGKETGSLAGGARLVCDRDRSCWPGSSSPPGEVGGLSGTFDVRWYYLLGGVLGAAYVLTALIVVKEIGAGGTAAATITGQLILSIVLDRLGVLGLEETPITWERLAGVLLLLAGTYLIVA